MKPWPPDRSTMQGLVFGGTLLFQRVDLGKRSKIHPGYTPRPRDAVREACHNPSAVWWEAFAAPAVIRNQVVIVKPVADLQRQECQ